MPVCELCHGRPPGTIVVARYASEAPPPAQRVPFVPHCRACRGSGSVPRWLAKRIQLGQQLKKRRLAAGVGLRQCAHSLGVLPSQFCEAEQGLISVADIKRLRRLLIARYGLTKIKPGYSVW